MAVKHRAAHLDHKKKSVRGNKANAHAEKEIKKAELRARLLGSEYNENYAQICMLRPSDYNGDTDESPEGRLQAIKLDIDLTIANMAAARSLGDSTKTGSWIWSVFNKSFNTRSRKGKRAVWDAESAVDSVQWSRAKAEKDRADEAVNKLCADFRRACAGYEAYAGMWRRAAHSVGDGKRAYAYKTAAMWSRMGLQCQQQYDGARKAGVPADTLDQTRSLREYLDQMVDDIAPFQPALDLLRM